MFWNPDLVEMTNITPLARLLHDYMLTRADYEATWYDLTPKYFADGLQKHRRSTSFFGVDVEPDENGEQRIMRDRLNPDALAIWRICCLGGGLKAIFGAETPEEEERYVGLLLELGRQMPDNPHFPTQLPREKIGFVEAIAERYGHVLDHEVDDYGSDYWALRVIEDSWIGRPGPQKQTDKSLRLVPR
jgi:hypothetical protein